MKSNLKKVITKFKNKFQSIRIKLFATLCVTVAIIIIFLVLINSVVLESYSIYTKKYMLLTAYEGINSYYNGTSSSGNIEIELEKLSLSNNFEILIKTDKSIYTSSRDFLSSLADEEYNRRKGIDENILYNSNNVQIKKVVDKKTDLSFILLSATLDNGYQLYIRTAIASIQGSTQIANRLLILIGIVTIVISGILSLVISRKFTSPIEELNEITSRISELDFSKKYNLTETEDEINNLRPKYKYNVRHA